MLQIYLNYINTALIITITVFILLLTSGCTGKNSEFYSFAGMPKPPTKGPPEYIAGWKDGCETGMTAYSHSMLRTVYSTKINSPMMRNKNYNKGWRLGNRYCNYYTSRYLSMGYFDDSSFVEQDLRPKNEVLNILDGFNLFKGWRRPGASDGSASTHGIFTSGGTHGLFPDGGNGTYGLF